MINHRFLKYRNNGLWVNLRQGRVLGESEVETVKKLRAQKVKSQFHHFPSKHEFNVWQALRGKLARNQEIVLQYPVKLIDSSVCCPKGKYWKADFAVFQKIEGRDRVIGLVEAKGYETPDFLHNLILLEAFKPELFQTLCIVYPKKTPDKGMIKKMVRNPAWNGCVYTLKEFQEQSMRFGGT